MRKPSIGWSEWARQDSNLRPLGDQRRVAQGSIVRVGTLSPAPERSIVRAEVRRSRPKTDDKVTVDHARRSLAQALKTTFEWTAITVTAVLYITAYTMIGWYATAWVGLYGVPTVWQELGLIVWVAAGLTGFVAWLGWYTGLIEFRPRRRLAPAPLPPAVDDEPTVEWNPLAVTAMFGVSGELLAGAR